MVRSWLVFSDPPMGLVLPALGVSGGAARGCVLQLPFPGSRGEGKLGAVHFAHAAHMAAFSDDERAENAFPEYFAGYWCLREHGERWHPFGELECHQHRVLAAPYFTPHFVLSIEYGLFGLDAE